MKFAIISAGEGSRLAQEGVAVPKPMVEIGGEMMIDRLIRIFTENGAEEIVVIVNELTNLVREHLEALKTDVPLKIVAKTTPSSMHSFYEISRYFKDSRFCLTTVDTIFKEKEFSEYIEFFKNSMDDGVMAVTDYIDDEKPLYVATAESNMQITGFYDSLDDFNARPDGDEHSVCKFISGGIYCLGPSAIETLDSCMADGLSRMRNFQRRLVSDGRKLSAYKFSKILDIDHADDIMKAEDFLAGK